MQYLTSLSNADEADLRRRVVASAFRARETLSLEVREMADAYLAEVDSIVQSSLFAAGNQEAWSDSYRELESLRSEIRALGTDLRDLHTIQGKALLEIQRYIEKPRAWKLVLQGFVASGSASLSNVAEGLRSRFAARLEEATSALDAKMTEAGVGLAGLVDAAVTSLGSQIERSVSEANEAVAN